MKKLRISEAVIWKTVGITQRSVSTYASGKPTVNSHGHWHTSKTRLQEWFTSVWKGEPYPRANRYVNADNFTVELTSQWGWITHNYTKQRRGSSEQNKEWKRKPRHDFVSQNEQKSVTGWSWKHAGTAMKKKQSSLTHRPGRAFPSEEAEMSCAPMEPPATRLL